MRASRLSITERPEGALIGGPRAEGLDGVGYGPLAAILAAATLHDDAFALAAKRVSATPTCYASAIPISGVSAPILNSYVRFYDVLFSHVRRAVGLHLPRAFTGKSTHLTTKFSAIH